MNQKRCTTCGEVKPLQCFTSCKTSGDGFKGQCNACILARRRAAHLADPSKRKNWQKRYSQEHREEAIARTRAWTADPKNRTRRAAWKRGYVELLGDSYIKEILIQNTGLKHADIPPELVALKRVQLKIRRLLKENHENEH